MATVGQQLTAPEAGWKRYDDNNSAIVYEGGWSVPTNSGCYGGSRHQNISHTSFNDKIKFRFFGTKLRLISAVHPQYSKNLGVKVDGVEHTTFSLYDPSTAGIHQVLVCEITGLSMGFHDIEIYKKEHGTNYPDFVLDAIDIDDTGRLLHPDEVTDIKDLEVGKRIRFNYVASSGSFGVLSKLGKETGAFIPTTSSATPSGDAYFIMVDSDRSGRKILVADRNIQHSISWDKLNLAGITSGSGLPYVITDGNLCVNGVPISGGDASGTNKYNAFDGVTSGSGWASSQVGTAANGVAYIGYDFGAGKEKAIRRIKLYQSADINNTVSSVKVQRSTDNITWVDVTVASGLGVDLNIIDVPNSAPSRYWRLLANSNVYHTTRAWNVYEVEMMEASFSEYNFTLRLLTGGVNSSDKDNEWDKYIINSTLNGTITAGDDTVWNNLNYGSMTSTTDVSNGAFRVIRGYNGLSNWTTGSTSVTSPARGFRPVLIIEKSYLLKYLIQDGIDLKITSDGMTLTTVGTVPATESLFRNNGMNNLTLLNNTILNLLNSPNPQILLWTDQPDPPAKNLYITGRPHPKYRYKIEISEPYTLLKDWSEYTDQNIIDSVIIPKGIINTLNPYTIKVIAEQLIDGRIIEGQGIITLYDTEPTLIATIQGLNVHLTIGDNESDNVQYFIKLNGTQIYPQSGWTPLFPSPVEITFTLNQNDILIGQQNTLEIFAQDEFGKQSDIKLTFIGDYAGILFMDENGEYYSNHIGEILKYLDFGAIIAGQITLPKKVRVVNKNGDPITNLSLTLDTSSIHTNTKIEMSRTDNPFTPESVINISGVLDHGDEVPIYVRIVTDKNDNPHSGTFEIHATADPV